MCRLLGIYGEVNFWQKIVLEFSKLAESGNIPPGIGKNCLIKKAIIDKNARIGRDVRIINKESAFDDASHEKDGWYIRDGIVVILKNAVIPNGSVI